MHNWHLWFLYTGNSKSQLNNLMWVRYRDSFITCLLNTKRKNQSLQSATEAKLHCVKQSFAKVYRVKLTLEQWGNWIS